MKVLIEIPVVHYDLFVAECDITSREYTILKNSIVTCDPEADPDRCFVEILCEEQEAFRLLFAATQDYPEVTHAITAAIDRARKSRS